LLFSCVCILIFFYSLQDSKLEILKFSYSWAEEVEREERERNENARMEVRIQMDLPVSLFDILHRLGNKA
jgi:hypothetical protein